MCVCIHLQLDRVFDRHNPLLIRDGTGQDVEESGLARAGVPGNDDVQPRLDTDRYKIRHGLRDGPLIDQVLDGQLVLQEAADGNTRALLGNRRNNGIDAGAILEMRIHHRVFVVHIPPERIDDVIDRHAQLELTLIFCICQDQFSILFDEDLVGAIDHDFADLRVIEEIFHRTDGIHIAEYLIQEGPFIFPQVAIGQLVGLEDQLL